MSHVMDIYSSLAALILGSIPFGVIVARIYKIDDLQSRGSGNIGATNVSRVLGFWPAGAIVFSLDLFKGALPILLVKAGVASRYGYTAADVSEAALWLIGFCAVAGHCFSPWVGFKGGKGVATGIGVLLALSPWAGLAGILAFGLTFYEKRTGSLASLAGLMIAAATHLVLYPPGAYLWFGGLIVWLIVIRHEKNIDALLQNRENSFL